MGSALQKADKFMESIKMHPDDIDISRSVGLFIDEMTRGLSGDSQLAMLPSFVDGELSPQKGKTVVVVDVGGTNLRVAHAVLGSDNEVILANVYKTRLPGLDEPISSDEFFSTVAKLIVPYLEKSSTISFSFAHEVEYLENKDGRVMRLSKEIDVSGISGQLIGERLKVTLGEMGHSGIDIIVVNDTVAGATSALNLYEEYDGFIGLVVGTGTNICYIEQCENIKKINYNKTKSMFINVEAARFSSIPKGESDIILDTNSEAPGQALLEKMTSGRYLGELFWLSVKSAVDRELLTESFSLKFKKTSGGSTVDLSEYMDGHKNSVFGAMCSSQQDTETLTRIGALIIARAAKIIATTVCGCAIKSGGGKDRNKPLCLVVEGTTYYQLKGLKKQVEDIIYSYLKDEKGVYVKSISIDDAVLKGTGLVAMT